MIPADLFDPFLKSLTLREPSELQNFEFREIIAFSYAIDGNKTISEPAVRVWFRTDLEITLDGFAKRIKEELKKQGHVANDEIIGALIALIALHPNHKDHPTELVSSFLSRVVVADLAQFFVYPYPPYSGFKKFNLCGFVLGELDSWLIRKLCRKAGSDFFERYEDDLTGKLALERKAVSIKVVDWLSLLSDYHLVESGTSQQLWSRSIEAYFGGLAGAYFDAFWESFAESQHLLVACGAPHLDGGQIRKLAASRSISIFLNINESWGFVRPGFTNLIVDFASVDRRIPELMRSIRDEFGVDACGTIPSPLRSYVLFLSKAKQYSSEGLVSESFLHYVIALELLFGEQQRAAESVSRRAAVLIAFGRGISLAKAEKGIDKLYDARSKYVHKGIQIDPGLLADADRACVDVLWSLLRCLKRKPTSADLLGEWTKDLDFLYAAVIAGKEVEGKDLLASGILLNSESATVRVS